MIFALEKGYLRLQLWPFWDILGIYVKFQDHLRKEYTSTIKDNHPHLQNGQAEMPKAVAATAPVATPPTAQCKRLARDCVMHALFRVGIP